MMTGVAELHRAPNRDRCDCSDNTEDPDPLLETRLSLITCARSRERPSLRISTIHLSHVGWRLS